MLGSGGGKQRGGSSLAARERGRRSGLGEWLSGLWGLYCVFLLICIVVTVPFVCCSVKLPLSWPTVFCLFPSILLRTLVGGGAATWRFCCQPQPNHNRSKSSKSFCSVPRNTAPRTGLPYHVLACSIAQVFLHKHAPLLQCYVLLSRKISCRNARWACSEWEKWCKRQLEGRWFGWKELKSKQAANCNLQSGVVANSSIGL